MNLERGGKFLIVGVPGAELDSGTAKSFREIQPGGFILFGRNIKSPEQLRKLTDDLRSVVKHEPVITIDQEGGRVSRLKEIGSEPPSARQLRARPDLIEKHGELTAALLRLFGFNLDLCPVLDLSFDDEADNSLKNRTYGRTPEEVITNAGAFNRGLRAGGVLGCGKHYPGYASAGVDPHHELPVIQRTRAELEACEWKPFRALQGELDSLMIGHVRNPHLDPSGRASSLSAKMLREVIRDEWNYDGLVMTDDLDMGAIINEYGFEEAVRLSLEAGNDMVLLCHRVEMAGRAAATLGELPDSALREAGNRVDALRARLAPPAAFSTTAFQNVDRQVYALREAVLGVEAAKQRSADTGKRSPVEVY